VLDRLGKLREAGWTPETWPGSTPTASSTSSAGKDLIIRGGHNIGGVIENALLAPGGLPPGGGRPVHGRCRWRSSLAPGADATPENSCLGLRPRAGAGRSPKVVTVLDSLPVTLVGKHFKPALRAEAVREAVADALGDIASVTDIRGAIEDGAVVAVVTLARGADQTPVRQALDRFAITWRLELS
jgi:fatty-acyl-CoA synthase